ncbi:MAG: hypothetical protein AWT59_1287 [Candidatus Gallionella acididurans]|uniref:Lipoprotein n=1 Tax=Candidatus Gallionella acididurans TaxID=1796491 RepID=A0A139BUB2_9PROT|nr:MAG: hypothetical protein AWT59_1287 [Candidatus Gallionella acididurans]
MACNLNKFLHLSGSGALLAALVLPVLAACTWVPGMNMNSQVAKVPQRQPAPVKH